MKVLQVITKSEEGGAQMVCLQTMEGLKDCNVDFEVAFYPDGWLHKRCNEAGIKVHPIRSMCKQISIRNDFRTFRRIRSIILNGKFDLVHCHSSKAGLLGRLAALSTSTPSVFTAHGWAFTVGASLSNRIIGAVSEFIAGKLSTKIICVSEFDHALGVRYRVASANKLTVIRNGAENIEPEFLAKPDFSGQVRITMVARFSNQKDQELLIRAAAKLTGDFKIVLVGDGPLLDSCKQLAADEGLSEKMEFMGTRNDVAEILSKSHIGVLTSHYEGLPISVIELIRAGLPVVASNVGGLAELIEDGSNGYLVAPGAVDSLTDKMQVLIDNPEKRRILGDASRAKYLSEYYIGRFLKLTVNLYNEIVVSESLEMPDIDSSTQNRIM